jgi:hypothetical protein
VKGAKTLHIKGMRILIPASTLLHVTAEGIELFLGHVAKGPFLERSQAGPKGSLAGAKPSGGVVAGMGMDSAGVKYTVRAVIKAIIRRPLAAEAVLLLFLVTLPVKVSGVPVVVERQSRVALLTVADGHSC